MRDFHGCIWLKMVQPLVLISNMLQFDEFNGDDRLGRDLGHQEEAYPQYAADFMARKASPDVRKIAQIE